MTVKELNQLFYLRRELRMYEKRLREIDELHSPQFDRIGSGSGISSPVVSVAEQREKIRDIIRGKQAEIALQEKKITEYILSIDDSLMRQIMYERHVNLKSWRAVAQTIGGGNTEQSVLMAHKRFLRKIC